MVLWGRTRSYGDSKRGGQDGMSLWLDTVSRGRQNGKKADLIDSQLSSIHAARSHVKSYYIVVIIMEQSLSDPLGACAPTNSKSAPSLSLSLDLRLGNEPHGEVSVLVVRNRLLRYGPGELHAGRSGSFECWERSVGCGSEVEGGESGSGFGRRESCRSARSRGRSR